MLSVVTPPAVEPVTVNEFRRDRRLDPLADDDTSSPEYLDSLRTIQAARGHVEQYTRRALIRQRLRMETTGRWVATPVRLLRPPVLEIASVTVDGAAVPLPDVEWDGHGLWPLTNGTNTYPVQWLTATGYARRVAVEYWAGYGAEPDDVPAPLRQAVLRIAADLWENREDSVVGTVAADVTHTAESLMAPFRVVLV